jgi:hypothetical protein
MHKCHLLKLVIRVILLEQWRHHTTRTTIRCNVQKDSINLDRNKIKLQIILFITYLLINLNFFFLKKGKYDTLKGSAITKIEFSS